MRKLLEVEDRSSNISCEADRRGALGAGRARARTFWPFSGTEAKLFDRLYDAALALGSLNSNMFPVAGDWIATTKTLSKKPTPVQIRNRLARRAAARREESLLPLIQSSTTFVVNGISEEFSANYETPEQRRIKKQIHAERMKLLHVQLPRLMERITRNRNRRILVAATNIQLNVWRTLKVLMKRSRGVKLLMKRRNQNQLLHLVPCWVKGFRTRRLVHSIHTILYQPLLHDMFLHWVSTQRQERLHCRYNYAYVRKNVSVWLLKTTLRKWQQFTHHLSRVRTIFRNIAMKTSNIRPCLNSWRAFTKQRKELKARIRRKMMGLKQAALHAWHDLTQHLVAHRLHVYLKFSKRLRHRNLLAPFRTLQEFRIQSCASKKLQAMARSVHQRQLFEQKKITMLDAEQARALKEREHIDDVVAKSYRKGTRVQQQKIKRGLLQHREMSHMRQKNVPATPRTKLLRPLFATYDLDNTGTIQELYLASVRKELGLGSGSGSGSGGGGGGGGSSMLLRPQPYKRLTNANLKELLQHTSFEKSFPIKFKRWWRRIRGTSIDSAVTGIMDAISLERIQLNERVVFRSQLGSSPHLECKGCGLGFVLWRRKLQHELVCGETTVLNSNTKQTEEMITGSTANTLREKLTTLLL